MLFQIQKFAHIRRNNRLPDNKKGNLKKMCPYELFIMLQYFVSILQVASFDHN